MIYCFDLDKTLCRAIKSKTKEVLYRKATPLKSRIEKVNDLYDEGHTIIIDSARGSVTGRDWEELTKKQLKDWGVKYHKMRVGVKFYADKYIDDKGSKDIDFFK